MSNIPTNLKKKGVYGLAEMSTTTATTVMQEPSSQFRGDGKTWDGSIVKVNTSPDASKHRGNDVSSSVNYGGHQKVKKRIKFGACNESELKMALSAPIDPKVSESTHTGHNYKSNVLYAGAEQEVDELVFE
ncbi:hypothetical protein QC764_210300 [Podospora pseudoanserina]|uniref:Uncharacterized protein n=1 Tax=Podospora pseudoanserina TaxID=2609844 RepID=A0ABR0IID8_9PEZI|nr:hypothetical protein QC764_210300 [Podospora pseudoanserina]